MASTGVINGTNLRLYAGGQVISKSTSCTMDLTANTLELIHKDNPGTGWSEYTIGQKSGTLSIEGFYAEDGSAQNPDDLFTWFNAETQIGFSFQTTTSGDAKYTGTIITTGLSFTAPVEDNSTFSATFQITGAVTKTTVT